MAAARRLREEEHAARARQHEAVGRVLAEAGHEWAAVPLFYAAYHVVKRALLVDPIFGDVSALQTINVDLIPDDRFTDRHHGRRRRGQPKEWGVNDLVLMLYRAGTQAYERLHQASIQVRYGEGLPTGADLASLVADLDHLRELESNDELRAPINWVPEP